MAVDRLTLFLVLSLTGGGLVANPSQSLTTRQVRESSLIMSPSELPTVTTAKGLLVAQDNGNNNNNGGESPSRFPKALILLGIGGVIITGGAVFILIRLLANPDFEEELEETEEINQANPQNLIQLQGTESSEPSPEGSLIDYPQLQPTVIKPEEPQTPTTSSPQKSLIDPHLGEPVTEPDEPETSAVTPPSSAPTEPMVVADSPQSLQIDRVEELILELQYPNPDSRSKAIWELAQNGDSRAIEPLVNLLFTSDSKQRSKILGALGEIGTRCLKPMGRALVFSLQDENPEVRQNAIRDLTRIYDLMYQTSQILQRAMDDPEPNVRETAHWAAEKLSRMRPLPISRNEPPFE